MKMKAKTYGIKILVASNLQLNIFSCKLLVIKKNYPIYFGFHSHDKHVIVGCCTLQLSKLCVFLSH